MSTSEIFHLIDKLSDFGVNALTYTGGEPTLRHDLPELIHYAGIEHDFIHGIATNGYLMPKLLRKYRFDGLDYILTSIDYSNPSQHNKIRGMKVFDKVVEMIQLANDRGIKVIISTVVMRDNINELDEICEFAENLGCSLELFPCEDIIRDFGDMRCKITNIDHMIPNISVWANTLRKLKYQYNNILTDDFSIGIVEKGGFGGYPDYHQDILRCQSAKAFLFISHDGYIKLPCKIHPILNVNALKYSFEDIYNSKEVREIIENEDNYKFCSGCRIGCAIAASIPTNWEALYEKYIRGFFQGNL